ncbi:MAG TPA: zinc ribbon domain-containing protein [Actinomycetota bacterium]|nr:zinc ribbon domain-containing protein [Actinomycetota bacterium]
MAKMFCPKCGLEQPQDHTFCVACGFRLPHDVLPGRRPKVSQWFWAVPIGPGDPPESALRVSCYLEEVEVSSRDGSVRVPADHVRFSIWIDDQAIGAVSISFDEAQRLVEFLQAWLPVPAVTA